MINSNEKLVSVIIPIYNVADYLETCIQSVRKQSYQNLEIILIDDGSTDGSGRICDRHAAEDARVHVLHTQNSGVTSARKKGLLQAKGYYTVFVDGDDWVDLDMYERLVQAAQESGAEVVTSGYYRETGSTLEVYDELEEGVYKKGSETLCQHMFYGKSLSQSGIIPGLWNKLFLTKKVRKYFMDVNEEICWGEDVACVYAYLPYAESVQILHKAFYHYRMRENSITHVTNEKFLYQLTLFYAHLLEAFKKHENYAVLKRQLDIYMTATTIIGLNQYMGFQEDIKIPLYILPEGVLQEKLTNIVLYGAGMVGQAYERQLQISTKGRLVLWVDKRAAAYRSKGKEVYDVTDVTKCVYDTVLIAVCDKSVASEIKDDLVKIGVPEEKIYWEMPKMFVEQYIKLI